MRLFGRWWLDWLLRLGRVGVGVTGIGVLNGVAPAGISNGFCIFPDATSASHGLPIIGALII